jgi:hypothetical protein
MVNTGCVLSFSDLDAAPAMLSLRRAIK